MDFGDILNQWDSIKKEQKTVKKGPQKSHKLANAPTKEEKEAMRQGYSLEQQMRADNEKQVNPMVEWLNRYGVMDKDRLNDEIAENNRMHDREYLRTMREQATVDLHGLTRDEAWGRLSSFVSDCQRRGLRKIMIIHGKGIHSNGSDPVLGEMVRLFIEQDKRLGASGHPDRNNGGNGATWVIIKK